MKATDTQPDYGLWERLRYLATVIAQMPLDHPHRAQVSAAIGKLERLVGDVMNHGADVRTAPDDREDG